MRCCVPFCKTTAETVSQSEGITFHEFPREVHFRAAWLRALGKTDDVLPAGAVVCSQHFLDDEIHKTESGSRQIRTGAVPATVLICLICLDTRNKLLPMSEHKLEQAYQHLVGYPPCSEGRLKRTLCVQCAQRLMDFSTFRDESLRVRRLLTEMLHTHEVITRRHVALLNRYKHPLPPDIEPDHSDVDTALGATSTVAAVTATNAAVTATNAAVTATYAAVTATYATDVAVAVKREVEHREDAHREDADTVAWKYNERNKALNDTPAAAEAEAESQAPMKREHSFEPESSEDSDHASDSTLVLATHPEKEEHPTDSSDDWDIFSFENNANVLENPRKSQDTALIKKESLATISDSINNYRTARRNERFKNEQSRYSPGIYGTQLGNHTDRIQNICYICQKMFQRKSSLVAHILAHDFAKTSCKLRECKLNQNDTLTSPKTKHTFACKLCKYKCTEKSSLVKHMRTHIGEKPFACKLCQYKCAQNNNLVQHMRTHTGEKPFACKLCKYKCAKNTSLMHHMRTHTGEKPFACKLCEYKCAQNNSLVYHMRTHTGEKPFACKLCQYKCAQNNNLVQHMRTHTGEKPFACELCKYKCTVKSSLGKHMRTHTGEKPFACKLCEYKCAQNNSLVYHMRTHTGEKPFACKLCEYKCAQNNSLVYHMRSHTGEKPFACKLCKYKCAKNTSLMHHMRTHTGEKPFACELCKYKCAVKSSLVKHMRTHTGEKPFACKLCEYKCEQNNSLVYHMRTHTGEKPFACELCTYKCTVKSSLVKHMKTHTGEKPFAC